MLHSLVRTVYATAVRVLCCSEGAISVKIAKVGLRVSATICALTITPKMNVSLALQPSPPRTRWCGGIAMELAPLSIEIEAFIAPRLCNE